MKLDVIYMDNHLLVVNKQQGLLFQGDETGDVDLVAMAKEHLKKKFNKPGNVFVGLATQQTTGCGFHCHASFIPTIEREVGSFCSAWCF